MPFLALLPWVGGAAFGVGVTLWFSDNLKWAAGLAAAGLVLWYLITKGKG